MFNLNDTHHEAGIILYGENTVGVFNWAQFDDGFIPMVGPFGFVAPWPIDAGVNAELVLVEHTDDVRAYIPGTVWAEEDGVATDLDIVYDENGDIPALWGLGETVSNYDGVDWPYSGDIWELPDGKKVITIDFWN